MFRSCRLHTWGCALALVAGNAHAVVNSGDVIIFPVSEGALQHIGSTGVGQVTVAGDSAAHLPTTLLGVGPNAVGLLDVSAGAKLQFDPLIIETPNGAVAETAVFVGFAGSGEFNVREGSTVDGVRYLGVGALPGSLGRLNVAGPGTVMNLQGWVEHDVESIYTGTVPADTQAALSIGPGGTGVVSVTAGGAINLTQQPGAPVAAGLGLAVTVGGGDVGAANGGSGELHVSGAGSRITVNGANARLWVGSTAPDFSTPGSGQVEISDGGALSLVGRLTSFDFAVVGGLPGTVGTLTVTGTGSRLDAGDVLAISTNASLTDFDPNNDIAAGTGLVVVRDGGVVEADFGVFIGAGGELRGDGQVIGSVINNGGTLAPGNSPGDLTVFGDVTLAAGGKLVLEIASENVFDRLLVTGDFRLAGGTIEFLFGEGVDPDVLTLLDIGDFLQTLSFDDDGNPLFGDGVIGESIFGLADVVFSGSSPGHLIEGISYTPGLGFQVNAAPIPLPSGIVLLAPALGCLLARRRRT